MRQLIVTEFISTDGVIDSPGGEEGYRHSGWVFKGVDFDPAPYEAHKGPEQADATALLLGRVSYEAFAPVWPTMVEDFAGYNAMPRYVVSTTLEQDDPGWPATILRSIDDVAKLKKGDGGPITVHGSATLAQSLAAAGLVDRYHLMVFPLLLGSGKRLFANTDQDLTKLELVEHKAYPNGVEWKVLDVVR